MKRLKQLLYSDFEDVVLLEALSHHNSCFVLSLGFLLKRDIEHPAPSYDLAVLVELHLLIFVVVSDSCLHSQID